MGHPVVAAPTLPSTSADLPVNVMAEGCSEGDIIESTNDQPAYPVPAHQVMPRQETRRAHVA
jgi:hypothetical protein